MNIYSGRFTKEGWFQTFINNEVFSPEQSLKVVEHSPDGFAWSYAGSGPAQLAMAILLKETHHDVARAHYIDFKDKVIANLPKEGWVLTGADVQNWLRANQVKEPLRILDVIKQLTALHKQHGNIFVEITLADYYEGETSFAERVKSDFNLAGQTVVTFE
jgi:hypothetical protein